MLTKSEKQKFSNHNNYHKNNYTNMHILYKSKKEVLQYFIPSVQVLLWYSIIILQTSSLVCLYLKCATGFRCYMVYYHDVIIYWPKDRRGLVKSTGMLSLGPSWTGGMGLNPICHLPFVKILASAIEHCAKIILYKSRLDFSFFVWHAMLTTF